MSIQIEKKNFFAIKREWEKLERGKKNTSPFHSYAFAKCLYKGYLYLCGRRGIPELFLLSEKNEVLMICPVVREKVNGEKIYSSFGSHMCVFDEDFLYPDNISDESLFECLCTLTKEIGAVSFEHVSKDSRLYLVGLQKGMIRDEEKLKNALITLPENYSEYYHKLSKNMRSTIRSAKNRLTTDGMTDDIKIYYGKQMPTLLYLRFTMLYTNSKDERYFSKRNRTKQILRWMYYAFFHFHAQALNTIDSSVCVIYRINKIPAAVLGGYLDKAKERVYWHRIGIDSRFKKYSPGIIMLQKTIEKMINDTDIRFFDLTIGGEEYKFRIGAEEYSDSCFRLVPIEEMR